MLGRSVRTRSRGRGWWRGYERVVPVHEKKLGVHHKAEPLRAAHVLHLPPTVRRRWGRECDLGGTKAEVEGKEEEWNGGSVPPTADPGRSSM